MVDLPSRRERGLSASAIDDSRSRLRDRRDPMIPGNDIPSKLAHRIFGKEEDAYHWENCARQGTCV